MRKKKEKKKEKPAAFRLSAVGGILESIGSKALPATGNGYFARGWVTSRLWLHCRLGRGKGAPCWRDHHVSGSEDSGHGNVLDCWYDLFASGSSGPVFCKAACCPRLQASCTSPLYTLRSAALPADWTPAAGMC